jgi:prepilin-type N-terminal cleavage/methylation domain-containing protein
MKLYGSIKSMRKQSGFTLLELMVVIAVIGISAAILTPNLLSWLPKHRLKGAARDLYSNMQLAKMAAINNSNTCEIAYFDTPDTYTISCLIETVNVIVDTVNLAADYGSGVQFDWTPVEGDFETETEFDSRGTVSTDIGYAYLSNADGSIRYRVGALISGAIKLEHNVGGGWQ